MKKLKKKISVTIEKTNSGYSAYANDMDVFTTARNIPELHKNLIEALNLAYESKGYKVSVDNLKLHLDLQQFFKFYKVLNAKFLAERIGMNPTLLSQYVRGKKTPSSKQTHRIIEGIQTIGKELSELRLA
ncbi:MAG: XRE family transcriptional regulator [Muriicola sp.]|nr:XRE family transcriptional regulator [Muriicola sp.]